MNTTKKIVLKKGHITFYRHFKYLGTWVSYNICNDVNVHTRIANANAAMGKLQPFWCNDCVDLKSKYFIFIAIPLNLLLWDARAGLYAPTYYEI